MTTRIASTIRQFWDNYETHLKAMVAQHKNRPSVVMWSLENEFLGGRLNDTSPAKQDLVRMGRAGQGSATRHGRSSSSRMAIPTAWPTASASTIRTSIRISPAGPTRRIGCAEPAKIPHMFLNGADSFVWQHDKPLYVGEFLWIPSSDPSWHTVFFGDEAYRDYQRYRNLAKAESWKMQILGYRDLEVGGMSPWTVIEGGPLDETNPLFAAHQYAYQPMAAYPLEYDTRFFSGERVTRRLAVFNDVLEPSTFVLRSQLAVDQRTIHTDQLPVALEAGQRTHVDVVLPMPDVTQRAGCGLDVATRTDGKRVFQDQRRPGCFPAAASTCRVSAVWALRSRRYNAGRLWETPTGHTHGRVPRPIA